MNALYKHNLVRLYLIKISHWFMLVMPIVVLFYQHNGLNIQQVFILQSIYSVSIVLFEIPSGYFADVLGRKNSLVSGAFLGFAGYAIYSVSSSFWGFVAAEIILGVGQSMISGADSAILYDSLIDNGKEDEYLRYEGKMVSVGNFAESIAGILGGLLAAISLRYPYIAQTIVTFIAIPASITLTEPKSSSNRLEVGWKQIFDVVHFSLIRNKQLKWNIIYSSIVGASTLTMAWFVQPWLIRANVETKTFGVIWTFLNLLVGVTAIYAYKIELYVGRIKSTLIITILIGLGFIASGWFTQLWALLFFVIFYIARGVATPLLKNSINQIAPSSMRATILSVRNFVIRIIFAIWGPFYGWITDKWSLAHALIIAGIIFMLLAAISFVFLVKWEKKKY